MEYYRVNNDSENGYRSVEIVAENAVKIDIWIKWVGYDEILLLWLTTIMTIFMHIFYIYLDK